MSTHTRKRAIVRRTLQWVAAGAVPFVITACYGPPGGDWEPYEGYPDTDADMDVDGDADGDSDESPDVLDDAVWGTVVSSVDGTGIAGIRVTCLDAQGAEVASVLTSGNDGMFILPAIDCTSLVFEDEDGTLNGGEFQDKEVSLLPETDTETDVTLDTDSATDDGTDTAGPVDTDSALDSDSDTNSDTDSDTDTTSPADSDSAMDTDSEPANDGGIHVALEPVP